MKAFCLTPLLRLLQGLGMPPTPQMLNPVTSSPRALPSIGTVANFSLSTYAAYQEYRAFTTNSTKLVKNTASYLKVWVPGFSFGA